MFIQKHRIKKFKFNSWVKHAKIYSHHILFLSITSTYDVFACHSSAYAYCTLINGFVCTVHEADDHSWSCGSDGAWPVRLWSHPLEYVIIHSECKYVLVMLGVLCKVENCVVIRWLELYECNDIYFDFFLDEINTKL